MCYVAFVVYLLSPFSFPSTGTESPQAVRKLMLLSDKVRPHNPKLNPLPAHHTLGPPLHSPGGVRRPVSPRQPQRAPAAVHLSAESSSVVSLGNMALRKSTTTSKFKLQFIGIVTRNFQKSDLLYFAAFGEVQRPVSIEALGCHL